MRRRRRHSRAPNAWPYLLAMITVGAGVLTITCVAEKPAPARRAAGERPAAAGAPAKSVPAPRQEAKAPPAATTPVSAAADAESVTAESAPVASKPATPTIPRPRVPSLERHAKPWHVRLSREDVLAAWRRVTEIDIPGVARDQRYEITGDEFYVSPDGDDAADGSKEKPWKTLAYACTKLAPNTVVYLMSGTYYGPVGIRGVAATSQAPAALRAAPGHAAYITYPDSFVAAERSKMKDPNPEQWFKPVGKDGKELHYGPLINLNHSTCVEISGLHFIGVRDLLPHNLYAENGVGFHHGDFEGCRVLYNEIEAVGHCAVKGGKGILIEGNYIHDNGQETHDHGYYGGERTVIRRNLFLNTSGWGVHAWRKKYKDMKITHNIFAGNDCHGVIVGSTGTLVAHNAFISNRKGGVFLFRGGCVGSRFLNNVFLGPAAFAYDNCGGKPGATPRDNLLDYNCLATGTKRGRIPNGHPWGAHNLTADPRVADAKSLDFGIDAASPCVDAGTNLGGQFHGRAPDIGPYEIPGDAAAYVSPDGDDANAGTREAPFKTIERAMKALSAGDVCVLSPGLYVVDQIRLGPAGESFERPTTFVAAPRVGEDAGRTVITGSDGRSPSVGFHDYVRIEGLWIGGKPHRFEDNPKFPCRGGSVAFATLKVKYEPVAEDLAPRPWGGSEVAAGAR